MPQKRRFRVRAGKHGHDWVLEDGRNQRQVARTRSRATAAKLLRALNHLHRNRPAEKHA